MWTQETAVCWQYLDACWLGIGVVLTLSPTCKFRLPCGAHVTRLEKQAGYACDILSLGQPIGHCHRTVGSRIVRGVSRAEGVFFAFNNHLTFANVTEHNITPGGYAHMG